MTGPIPNSTDDPDSATRFLFGAHYRALDIMASRALTSDEVKYLMHIEAHTNWRRFLEKVGEFILPFVEFLIAWVMVGYS